MTAPVTTPSTAGHGLHRSFPPLPSTASLPADRRGRLRNGARPGDFLAAPRCGAYTRGGCSCRQPAMANGRCRPAARRLTARYGCPQPRTMMSHTFRLKRLSVP